MRVQGFGGPEVLVLGEVERPRPAPTEVLVRVHAAGVNPVDWKTRAGEGMAGLMGSPPFTVGWDVSGVVEELGFGVTRFDVGDQVFGMVRFPHQGGAYAEYLTAPARHLAPKPLGLSHVQAAATPLAALTAWQALVDTAHVQAGQTVLIHGAGGGVGHLAVQIAKAHGARVVGTASAGKQDFVYSLGADEAVDYHAVAFERCIAEVDVVLDTVGGDYITRSIETLKAGGLLITIPSGVSDTQLSAGAKAGVRVTGLLVEPDYAALAKIADLMNSGRVQPEIDTVVPLEQAAKAHEIGERGHTRGKLVLQVRD
jgi:NADPH:quinone reductase-like Zn-dependent oxidoreductase